MQETTLLSQGGRRLRFAGLGAHDTGAEGKNRLNLWSAVVFSSSARTAWWLALQAFCVFLFPYRNKQDVDKVRTSRAGFSCRKSLLYWCAPETPMTGLQRLD